MQSLATPTFNQREVSERLKDSCFELHYEAEVTTTMNVTKYINNPKHGDVLVAGVQTEGTGTGEGTKWLSNPQDIKFTYVIDPKTLTNISADPDKLYLVSAAAVMASIEACIGCCPLSVNHLKELLCYKLPNDLRVHAGEKYQKIGGILAAYGSDRFDENCELRTSFNMLQEKGFNLPDNLIYLGVGVNLGKDLVEENAKSAGPVFIDGESRPFSEAVTSLEHLTGALIKCEDFIIRYFTNFKDLLDRLQNEPKSFLLQMEMVTDPKPNSGVIWYETDTPDTRRLGTLINWCETGMEVKPEDSCENILVRYSKILRALPAEGVTVGF